MHNGLKKLSNTIIKATKRIKYRGNWLKQNKEIDKAFAKIGFEYLASGCARRVYASKDGKYVIKFDKNGSDEYSQNKPEIEHLKLIPKKLRHYFVKPLAYDTENFFWILTHRAKNHKDLEYEKTNKIVRKLRRIFEKNGLLVDDLHNENVGTLNGESVVLDYGYKVENLREA